MDTTINLKGYFHCGPFQKTNALYAGMRRTVEEVYAPLLKRKLAKLHSTQLKSKFRTLYKHASPSAHTETMIENTTSICYNQFLHYSNTLYYHWNHVLPLSTQKINGPRHIQTYRKAYKKQKYFWHKDDHFLSVCFSSSATRLFSLPFVFCSFTPVVSSLRWQFNYVKMKLPTGTSMTVDF